MQSLTLWDHGYFVSIMVIFAYAILVTQPKLKGQSYSSGEKIGFFWAQSLFLFTIASAVLAIWLLQGRSLFDLGITAEHHNFGLAITLGSLFLGLYGFELAWTLLSKKRRHKSHQEWWIQTPFMPTSRKELPHAAHMAIAAGLCEEVVFRGYLIHYSYFLITGKGLWSAAGISWDLDIIFAILVPGLLFGLAHLYHGWKKVAKIVVLAVFFGCIFVLTQSLLLVILLHIFIDMVACLLGITVFKESPFAIQKEKPATSKSISDSARS